MSTTNKTPKRLRSLHAGVGNRGQWPLKIAREHGFDPVALCDLNPEFLQSAREMTGLDASACFRVYESALASGGFDCVIICTPTVFHVPMSLQAIAAGYPVLVEKGMAPDWTSAQKLATAVEKAGIPLAVAQNYRFGAVPALIRRALTDPDFEAYLGPVHQVVSIHNRVRPEPRTLTYPFASVWDMSCHHFDNLLYWLGPVARMQAFAWSAPWSAYEHPNNTSAHMEMESGAAVTYLHTHDAARASEEIQLHGERGALYVRDNKVEFSQRPVVNFGSHHPTPIEPGIGEDGGGVLRVFHEWIVEDKEPGISARHNLETMACCEMMVRSITEGRMIERSELDA